MVGLKRLKEIETKEDARLGYETAVGLVSLVSEEIYNRHNAMLILHGLLVTAIFGFKESKSGTLITLVAAALGFLLCLVWFFQIHHGLYYQDRFRKIAGKLEGRFFKDTFRIFSGKVHTNSDGFALQNIKGIQKLATKLSFELASGIVILSFVVFYVLMFLKSLKNGA